MDGKRDSCNGCKDRSVTCHGTCEFYKRRRELQDAKLAERALSNSGLAWTQENEMAKRLCRISEQKTRRKKAKCS